MTRPYHFEEAQLKLTSGAIYSVGSLRCNCQAFRSRGVTELLILRPYNGLLYSQFEHILKPTYRELIGDFMLFFLLVILFVC